MKTLLQFDGCRLNVSGQVCGNEIRVALDRRLIKACANFLVFKKRPLKQKDKEFLGLQSSNGG